MSLQKVLIKRCNRLLGCTCIAGANSTAIFDLLSSTQSTLVVTTHLVLGIFETTITDATRHNLLMYFNLREVCNIGIWNNPTKYVKLKWHSDKFLLPPLLEGILYVKIHFFYKSCTGLNCLCCKIKYINNTT